MAAHGKTWRYMAAIHGNTWQYMAIHGNKEMVNVQRATMELWMHAGGC